ncbi:MAG: alpha/beta hydrolase [Pseudomonadales bacterium]|nr:alpha/beta hydrolase [Pseudomonadales bacterium]MCP5331331.1 alpha/beta hydrolase [Pseudomonadales bacterium]MCP5344341.1 alpha/beta hydrolase [Pseudomonadales bacterium]
MTEKMAHDVGPAKIDIAYACHGNPANPAVLLIMGVGGQMIAWSEGFIEQLVSKGLHVVCFDNRDAGLSTHFHDNPLPDLPAALKGDFSSVGYTLSDMAADALGLLDFLGISRAHIVGLSMGGYIGQTLAIEHPERVLSLVSMMATTGAANVGQPDPAVLSAMSQAAGEGREAAAEAALRVFRIIGSPAFPTPDEVVRGRTLRAYDRARDVLGVARQAIASVASGDRTEKLKTLTVPTLVIHGDSDKMCDVSGGRATAAAIPGARLEIIEGLGHDLPEQLWPRLAELIAQETRAA